MERQSAQSAIGQLRNSSCAPRTTWHPAPTHASMALPAMVLMACHRAPSLMVLARSAIGLHCFSQAPGAFCPVSLFSASFGCLHDDACCPSMDYVDDASVLLVDVLPGMLAVYCLYC